MPKTAPTATNAPGATAAAGDVLTRNFREDQHRGHALTHVGSFRDKDSSNQPYDVWYCQNDHVLLVA